MNTLLLLLADSRFPSGGHAHSAGLEAAVAAGRVRCPSTLELFLIGRLHTTGLVNAAFAAVAHAGLSQVLDAEFDARTPSPAQRLASRRQGKALMRAAQAIWPVAAFRADPHFPLAVGVTASAAGLSEMEASSLAVYHQITGQASAALRLLGLSPYDIQATLVRLAPQCDAVTAQGAAFAGKDPAELPMLSSPIADISAEHHATWEVRLFAS